MGDRGLTVLLCLGFVGVFVVGGAEQCEDDAGLGVDANSCHNHFTAAFHHVSTCDKHERSRHQTSYRLLAT